MLYYNMETYFIITFIIFFIVKAFRDYIMDYEKGNTAYYERSILSYLPDNWFKWYLLDEPIKCLESKPPKWFMYLAFGKRYGHRYFGAGIDGWHQLDGLIFLLPFILAYISIWGINLWIIPMIIVFYQLFNLFYHALLLRRPYRDWSRTPVKHIWIFLIIIGISWAGYNYWPEPEITKHQQILKTMPQKLLRSKPQEKVTKPPTTLDTVDTVDRLTDNVVKLSPLLIAIFGFIMNRKKVHGVQ